VDPFLQKWLLWQDLILVRMPANSQTALKRTIIDLMNSSGGKNALFESYLVSDLQYVGLASVIIFFTVLTFTKSFFVTVISFGILLLSLGTSYYFYKTLFSIEYFPFMNMLVTIILLGKFPVNLQLTKWMHAKLGFSFLF